MSEQEKAPVLTFREREMVDAFVRQAEILGEALSFIQELINGRSKMLQCPKCGFVPFESRDKLQ